MAKIPKSKARSGVRIKRLAAEAKNLRLTAHDKFPNMTGNLPTIDDVVRSESSENADEAILRDIDAILSRLDAGISKANKTMDDLLERIRQPAA